MVDRIWSEVLGEGPVVAVAVHAGNGLRREVEELMALAPGDRLREEDPFTDEWATVAPTRLAALRSRFEVDLNRPRDSAVYLGPEDAWGLEVWRRPLPADVVERSLAEFDRFYDNLGAVLRDVERRHGRFVVLDLHSYNHRREGPDGPPADERDNPQVNVGTGSMDRERWAPVVDRFMADLRAFDHPDGPLDVRENVKFRGRNVAAFVHAGFPTTGCVLATEVKKTFMDEWTGEPDPVRLEAIRGALASTLPGLVAALEQVRTE